ncbi:MAG TPA: carboxymuconolactone decarboxylase family protein [Pyrinomonadaceae bacterium]|jgi:AhpD family alkylhydroperoxidase
MKTLLSLLVAVSLLSAGSSSALGRDAPKAGAAPVAFVAVAELERAAQSRLSAAPRVALADVGAESLKAASPADPLEGAEAPNYIRALARQTGAAPQFARLVRVALYGGTLPHEIKMAMALRVAQQLNSPYTAAHASRWLRASERGRELLARVRDGRLEKLPTAEQLALSYADSLTHGVHDVSDADFARVRAHFNDAQLVELTMAVCFFNYFTRMNEALGLPVETWALEGQAATPPSVAAYRPPPARVALISDEEMSATGAVAAAARQTQAPAAGLGLGVANSQRAMLRVPDLAQAWRAYGQAVRENASIGRDIQLQVSFAVSMVNGCRYCTLHQVLGLRRLGVEPSKLVAMKKDDSQLTPRELAAVAFARLVTRAPAAVSDADFGKLKAEFGERGALEVLLQTCAFSFMNRFTDGLRLPSEDEAVRVYRETYGSDWR